MRLTTLGLAAALVLTNAFAFAQGGTAMSGAAASANLNAGGITAGANSMRDPSGNSFINTSPSGSTLGPSSPSGR